MRGMVSRLDSARMSALFTQAVADTREDFLSPRTELTVEDVRRLRLDHDDSAIGASIPCPIDSFIEAEAMSALCATDEPKIEYGNDLLPLDTGDAESWLVASPSMTARKDDLEDYFLLKDSHRPSFSRPRSTTTASEAKSAKSSMHSDPPFSPDPSKVVPDSGRESPPGSKIPRTFLRDSRSPSPTITRSDHEVKTPVPDTPQKAPQPPRSTAKLAMLRTEPARKVSNEGSSIKSKIRSKIPMFGRNKKPSPVNSSAELERVSKTPSPGPQRRSRLNLRRSSSIASNCSEVSEPCIRVPSSSSTDPCLKGILQSPRSEIVCSVSGRQDSDEGTTSVFGRKKRLFGLSRIGGGGVKEATINHHPTLNNATNQPDSNKQMDSKSHPDLQSVIQFPRPETLKHRPLVDYHITADGKLVTQSIGHGENNAQENNCNNSEMNGNGGVGMESGESDFWTYPESKNQWAMTDREMLATGNNGEGGCYDSHGGVLNHSDLEVKVESENNETGGFGDSSIEAQAQGRFKESLDRNRAPSDNQENFTQMSEGDIARDTGGHRDDIIDDVMNDIGDDTLRAPPVQVADNHNPTIDEELDRPNLSTNKRGITAQARRQTCCWCIMS